MANMKPKVTIIIPTYNKKKEGGETWWIVIASILSKIKNYPEKG